MSDEKVDAGDLDTMLERYRVSRDACADAYQRCADDIRFVTVPGAQWDGYWRNNRGDRPMYEFPKLMAHVRMTCNEIRKNRPQGKVRATNDSDTGLAEIMQGLCRSIEAESNAESAYDSAIESAVMGGFGAWRICTRYEKDRGFNQSLEIEPIRNPFGVTFDPAAVKLDRSDARYVFVEQTMSREEFRARWPDAVEDGLEDAAYASARSNGWVQKETVRVAEYWYKEPIERELLQLSNGAVVYRDELAVSDEELAAGGIQIVKSRAVESHRVMMRLTNGVQWLDKAEEFPSRHIPIVPVWGTITMVDGEEYWQGMVRPAKDAQRLHNMHRTAMIEAVAKAPKAPFIVFQDQIEGLEPLWNRANADDMPYLPVKDTGRGYPQRANQAEVPAALIELARMDNDDIKASTGMYDATLGQQSNEISGVAISARRAQGAMSTFHFTDNLCFSIRHSYEILIDAIPRVYDTQRVVRILGQDYAEDWVQLYGVGVDPQTGEVRTVNDISRGEYDVTVTTGPTYATQRQEAVEGFSQLAAQMGGAFPALQPLLAYYVMKNLDLPGGEDIADALRGKLVAMGLLPPGPNDPPPGPQQPTPMQQAQLAKVTADARKSMAQAEKAHAEAQVAIPSAMADAEYAHMTAQAERVNNAAKLQQLQAQQLQAQVVPQIRMTERLPTPNPGGFSI